MLLSLAEKAPRLVDAIEVGAALAAAFEAARHAVQQRFSAALYL